MFPSTMRKESNVDSENDIPDKKRLCMDSVSSVQECQDQPQETEAVDTTSSSLSEERVQQNFEILQESVNKLADKND